MHSVNWMLHLLYAWSKEKYNPTGDHDNHVDVKSRLNLGNVLPLRQVSFAHLRKNLNIKIYTISVVGTVTKLRTRKPRPWFSSWRAQKTFFFSKSAKTYSGAHPVPYWTDSREVTPEIKLPSREADHSPICNDKVKNELSYTSTLPYDFMACKGTFTSQLYLLISYWSET